MGIIKRVAQEGMMGGRPPMGGGWGMVPALPPVRAASSLHPSCGGSLKPFRTCRYFRGVVLLTPSAQRGTRAKHLWLSWVFLFVQAAAAMALRPGCMAAAVMVAEVLRGSK